MLLFEPDFMGMKHFMHGGIDLSVYEYPRKIEN
jgi:hypothetical protein